MISINDQLFWEKVIRSLSYKKYIFIIASLWIFILIYEFNSVLHNTEIQIRKSLETLKSEFENQNSRYTDLLKYTRATFLAQEDVMSSLLQLEKNFVWNEKNKIYELAGSYEKNYGALTYQGKNIDSETKKIMAKAMNLGPLFKEALIIFPKSAWIYFTTENFIYIYPYVSSNEFKYSQEIHDTEFYKINLPANNPNKKINWTNPYYDLAGKGMIVTESVPIYIQGKYIGTISIDVTLSEIRSRLDLSPFQMGDLTIVNGEGNLIATNHIYFGINNKILNIFSKNELEKFKHSNKFQKVGDSILMRNSSELNNLNFIYTIPIYKLIIGIIPQLTISILLMLIIVPFFIWLYYNNKLQIQIEADNTYKNKLISLAEMSGGIAHEINNPLTVISGRTIQTIRKINHNEISPDEIIKNLEKIHLSSDRISKIIKAMKNFSRNEENQNLQKCTLKELIEDTLLLCENRINNDETSLEIEQIPNIEIQCHPFQIVQILINLINNSFDATSSLSEKWIKISFQIKPTNVLVIITDSGSGIPKDYQKKIFDPFFTSKQLTFGTGLGLSISKKIALAHRGDLKLDVHNPNTCFILTLPTNFKKS